MRIAMMFVFLAVLSSPAAAQTSSVGGSRYETQFEIYDGERLIGRPMIRAESGSSVVVTKLGQDGYALRATSSVSANESRVEAELWYASKAGQWTKVATPIFSMSVGDRAQSIVKGAFRPAPMQGKDLRISVDVRPTAIGAIGKEPNCQSWTETEWREFLAEPVPGKAVLAATAVQSGGSCSIG